MLARQVLDSRDRAGLALVKVGLSTLTQVKRHAFAVRDNLIIDDVENAIRESDEFLAAGGRTMVEVTSHGIDRDVRALEIIARRTGLQVIAGCGYYIQLTHPRGIEDRSEQSLADEMIEEITVGDRRDRGPRPGSSGRSASAATRCIVRSGR